MIGAYLGTFIWYILSLYAAFYVSNDQFELVYVSFRKMKCYTALSKETKQNRVSWAKNDENPTFVTILAKSGNNIP